MKIANIVSVPAFNVARAVIDGSSYKKGTSEELASSMLQHGWDETSFIGVRIPTDSEIIVMGDYLNMERDRLEQLDGEELAYNLTLQYDDQDKAVKTRVTNAMLLAEFENTYFTKGKLKPLTKVKATVFGHHRTHMVLVANAARANNGLKRIEPKVLEHDYKDQDEWRGACIKENAQRERAATSITTIDILRQAKELRDQGHTESKHRKELGNKKVGLIQQAWRYLKLDSAFPDLQLYGRATLKEGEEKHIAYKSLNKERLKALLNTDDDGASADMETVAAYVSAPLSKENKPLSMGDLKTVRESCPNALLKSLLNDIATGKRNGIQHLNANSTLYNAVQKALPKGVAVLSHAESIAVLEQAIETIKASEL